MPTPDTHPKGFDWSRLHSATPADPLRVLFSACTLGNKTGWEGDAYTEPLAVRLSKLPCVRPVAFCPEDVSLGTPRPLTTLYDGNGHDVLAGTARVLDTTEPSSPGSNLQLHLVSRARYAVGRGTE